MTSPSSPPERRRFLHHAAAAVAVAVPGVAAARVAPPAAQSLAMLHTHTGERIEIVFAQGRRYLPQALGALNHFLRDHYSGEVGPIDPGLFGLLHRLQATLGSRRPFEVISGYRGAATNRRLRANGGGGVATRSLHMQGQAIDVRLPGVALADLRDAALALRAGGVGYYERSQFVHLDTGRVRRW